MSNGRLLKVDAAPKVTKEGYSAGKAIPRTESKLKVDGESVYLEDIHLGGMLYGKILRSPLPHARILNIDTKPAERLPGVKAVITAKDTPRIRFSFVPELADKKPLCEDKVRYIGDEVAAVAATD